MRAERDKDNSIKILVGLIIFAFILIFGTIFVMIMLGVVKNVNTAELTNQIAILLLTGVAVILTVLAIMIAIIAMLGISKWKDVEDRFEDKIKDLEKVEKKVNDNIEKIVEDFLNNSKSLENKEQKEQAITKYNEI